MFAPGGIVRTQERTAQTEEEKAEKRRTLMERLTERASQETAAPPPVYSRMTHYHSIEAKLGASLDEIIEAEEQQQEAETQMTKEYQKERAARAGTENLHLTTQVNKVVNVEEEKLADTTGSKASSRSDTTETARYTRSQSEAALRRSTKRDD